MTTNQPPTYYFPNIDFNDAFYIQTPSSGITQSTANALYLGRQGAPISIATNTNFTGPVQVGNTTLSQTGNNLSFVNGSNTALTLTNTSNTSSLSGYSTMAYLNPIPSGIMYLTGTSGFSSGSYNLETDTYGHLNFATGTNTLNVGILGTANGNLNLYNQGVLTIPDATGNAISVPNGNINSNTISTTTTATIGTSLNVGNQIYMTGSSTNRSINNVFYNFNDATTFSNDGRIYANGTYVFIQALVNNGILALTTRDNSGLEATQVQITSAGVTILPLLTTSANIAVNGANSSILNNTLGGSLTIGTPNSGSNIYLGANNVIGLTITQTAVVNSLNLSLPTTYSTIPSINQLGGSSQITFTASQAITTNVFKNLGSITTPAGGTYIINLSVSISCTVLGTLTRHVIEASTSSTVFTNNISQQQQYESIALIATNGQVWTTSYTIQATTATTIYGNVLLAFTGTMTGTGLISYTRIA